MSTSENKGNALQVRQPIPTTVRVGGTYDYMFNNDILHIKVEKIIPETDNAPVIVLWSQSSDKKLIGRTIHSTPATEFKTRILLGGLQEIDL